MLWHHSFDQSNRCLFYQECPLPRSRSPRYPLWPTRIRWPRSWTGRQPRRRIAPSSGCRAVSGATVRWPTPPRPCLPGCAAWAFSRAPMSACCCRTASSSPSPGSPWPGWVPSLRRSTRPFAGRCCEMRSTWSKASCWWSTKRCCRSWARCAASWQASAASWWWECPRQACTPGRHCSSAHPIQAQRHPFTSAISPCCSIPPAPPGAPRPR